MLKKLIVVLQYFIPQPCFLDSFTIIFYDGDVLTKELKRLQFYCVSHTNRRELFYNKALDKGTKFLE